MASYLLILLIVATASLALASYSLFRRASSARRELSKQLHDSSLRLDLRCDLLQTHLDKLNEHHEHRRIDHLFALVSSNQIAGLLSAPAAEALRRYVLDLHFELLDASAEETKT